MNTLILLLALVQPPLSAEAFNMSKFEVKPAPQEVKREEIVVYVYMAKDKFGVWQRARSEAELEKVLAAANAEKFHKKDIWGRSWNNIDKDQLDRDVEVINQNPAAYGKIPNEMSEPVITPPASVYNTTRKYFAVQPQQTIFPAQQLAPQFFGSIGGVSCAGSS